MFRVLEKMRTVVSIDLCDDDTTKAVLVSSNGERFLVEEWDFYSEQNSGSTDFLQGYKPEAATVILGDAHTLCFAVPELSGYNLELEKRKRGVTVETQYADYLNISRSAILAAIHRETANEILKSVKDTFPAINQFSISQSMVALLYIYLRSYRPQAEIRTALLHITGQLVSLLVVQTEMPVWQGSIEIKAGDKETNYSEICALLQSANEKLSQTNYDLLLLAGDCDEADVKAMRSFATQVELLQPYRNGAFEIGRISGFKRKETQQHGHRLAVALGGAGLILESVGLNLADTDLELQRELPLERIIRKEQTPVSKVLDISRLSVSKTLSFLFLQRKIIAISLLAALTLAGYRFLQLSSEKSDLALQLSKEQARAATLSDIRAKHDEYKDKISSINARVVAISDIRKSQLTVRTVLDQLDQRIPKGLVFTELDIQETNLTLKGYAPERPAAIALANRLGQSVGIFADVVPIYDDKTNVGNYTISCKYIGAIPPNDVPLPAQQQPAKQ
ncbi:MAG: PilN domain-containing protein [Acidobacteriota bacterium]